MRRLVLAALVAVPLTAAAVFGVLVAGLNRALVAIDRALYVEGQ